MNTTDNKAVTDSRTVAGELPQEWDVRQYTTGNGTFWEVRSVENGDVLCVGQPTRERAIAIAKQKLERLQS